MGPAPGYIRGEAREQVTMFPVTLEELIPADHLCRVIEDLRRSAVLRRAARSLELPPSIVLGISSVLHRDVRVHNLWSLPLHRGHSGWNSCRGGGLHSREKVDGRAWGKSRRALRVSATAGGRVPHHYRLLLAIGWERNSPTFCHPERGRLGDRVEGPAV